MENKLKILVLVVFSAISTLSFGQYSVGGGFSTLHGAGIDITRYGLNLYYETPRTEVNTFYLRANYMLPQKITNTTSLEANSPSVSPQKIDGVRFQDKTSFFSIDGGTRIYFINTYDAGFSLYGGGHLKGIVSSWDRKFDVSNDINTDEYSYVIEGNYYNVNDLEPSYALLFSFGGNFGAKYQLPYRGAIVFDLALDLISRLYDPAQILGQEISPLSLSFNLAYRFDWY